MDTTATGDKAAQSYGWRYRLEANVGAGMGVSFPVPGFDTRYTDTRYAEVTLASVGKVWRTGQGDVDVTFDTNVDPVVATVTNVSGPFWGVREELYLFCPHLLAEGANEWDLKGQIWDLQQRLLALEGGGSDVADLQTRLAAAESSITDLQSRVQALENASTSSITLTKSK
jgi:hypothetical protein